jgi:hypothetical protein
MKTGICSLLLGLSGAIAWQFGFVPIGFVLIFFYGIGSRVWP